MSGHALLCGNDRSSLIDERNARISRARNGGMDVRRIDLAEDGALDDLLAATAELSLLATARLIIGEGAETLGAKDITTSVRETLAAPVDDVAILLVAHDSKKARCPKALKDAVKDGGGEVVTRQTLKPREATAAARMVVSQVAQLAISERDASRLAAGCGNSLARIRRRCEQLAVFTELGSAAANTELIDLVCGNADQHMWDALDALAAGDIATVLNEHEQLAERGQDGGLLTMAIRRARDLATVRTLLDQGLGTPQIAEHTGAHPFVTEQRVRVAGRLTGTQIATALVHLGEGEHAARGGTHLAPRTATTIALRDAANALAST
ncbi:MAG: hypothetical protein JHD16_00385 [Solirubrobacteraceae bacterium]|nr:hypothetical protein [Solirubrobacteraceae bacterium]